MFPPGNDGEEDGILNPAMRLDEVHLDAVCLKQGLEQLMITSIYLARWRLR